MSALSTLLLGSVALRSVFGHSWAECTKYEAVVNGQDYQVDECSGYPRGFVDVNMKDFGLTNIAANTASNDEVCQSAIGDPDNGYSSTYADSGQWRMATYVLGETLRILWPAKNHAIGDECGETQSSSNQLKLFVNPQVNPTFDPTVGDVDDIDGTSSWVLLTDWRSPCNAESGKGVEGCGYANCPSYCENTDEAVCFGDYVLDNDVFESNGYYTFMWYWEFTGGAHWTTCWEAYVVTDGSVALPTAQPGTSPSPVEAPASSPVTSPVASPVAPPTTPAPVSSPVASAISARAEGGDTWLRLQFSDVDASSCGDSIAAVQSSDDGSTWIDKEPGNYGTFVYQWDFNGLSIGLPISIRFEMTSGNVIVLDDFVTEYHATMTATQTICDDAELEADDGVLTPSPTGNPTASPIEEDVVCISQSSVMYIEVAGFLLVLAMVVGVINIILYFCGPFYRATAATKYGKVVSFDSEASC